jgi:hypothetical protein
MLTECVCEQVIEVQCLNEHLLSECQSKDEFNECPKCKEAIPIAQFKSHTEKNTCKGRGHYPSFLTSSAQTTPRFSTLLSVQAGHSSRSLERTSQVQMSQEPS